MSGANEVLTAYVDGSYNDELKRYAFGCVFLPPQGGIYLAMGNGENPETVFHMRPYFEALKSIGFTGGVSCEPGKGGWGRPEDLAKNLETTLKTLRSLI